MSRLLNMADPEDRNMLQQMNDARASAIKALIADEESRGALETLVRKGWETSVVHSAMSAMKRQNRSL